MIIGLGNDICNIERIEQSYKKFGQHFIKRCFGKNEQGELHQLADEKKFCASLAKRFAAKEAFSNLPDKKIPRVKELNAEYAEVLAKKKSAYAEYRQAKKEIQDYVTAKHNIDAFLRVQENEQERKKQREAR